MHARHVQECAEEGGRGAKKGSPAPRIRTAVATVRRRARRSQKLTGRTRSSSSPPTSRLASFDRRRPPAKLRKGLWAAEISSALETSVSDSSYVTHERCTRPQTPKIPNAPTRAAREVTCWCKRHIVPGWELLGVRRGATPGTGPVGMRLGAARASAGEKESRLSRRARGPARHLSQEKPSIVDFGPRFSRTWAETYWHRVNAS